MGSQSVDELAVQLGDRMRTWRTQQGLTLEQAGQRMGVDLQAWDRWEKAGVRNPTLRTLLRIAAAMDVDLPTLVADFYWPDGEITNTPGDT